jgi:tape measure domain-containing protein
MPQIDPVILQLRADVKQYQNEIRATTTLVSNQLDRQERSILSLEHNVERSTGRISGSFRNMGTSITGYLAGFTAGVIVKELASLADKAKQMEAQLKLATATFGTFGQAQEDVQRISAETRTALEDTTALYGGFTRAAEANGKTQTDAARAVETFSKALKIGGAGTAQVASATLQLNQALSSTTPQWEELGQVFEASPRVQRLIADSLGVTSGALKQLISDGKLSSDQLFDAFTGRKFTAGIDAEFKQIPVTFGDAMQAMENTAVTTFGQFDKGGRFSEAIVTFLGTGTDTFKGLTSRAEEFGSDTRAVMDGLGNVFDPILFGGNRVFDALGIRIYSVREQIASLLTSFDGFLNIDANIENAFKRGLNRAIDRAGGGKKFEMSAISNLGGNFKAGARVSSARSRVDASARRLEGLGYIVPRNADGSVNEAGIVRRPTAPRRTAAAPSSGGGGGGSRPRASGGGRSTARAGSDADSAGNLIAAIRKDLLAIDQRGGALIRTEAEDLEKSSRNFRSVFGDEGQSSLDDISKDYDRARDVELEAKTDAEERAQDLRERNVYQLAGLYESLFQEGTTGLWRNFKDQALRTLALVAAQATIASFSSGGGGAGSLFGNIAKGLTSAFGGGSQGGSPLSMFGRASGGYMAPGSVARVNEGRGGVELLRMGAQGGTVIPLGQTQAVQRGGGTTVIHAPQFNLKGAVVTRELYRDMQRISQQSAAQAGGVAYKQALSDTPARLSKSETLGT